MKTKLNPILQTGKKFEAFLFYTKKMETKCVIYFKKLLLISFQRCKNKFASERSVHSLVRFSLYEHQKKLYGKFSRSVKLLHF